MWSPSSPVVTRGTLTAPRSATTSSRRTTGTRSAGVPSPRCSTTSGEPTSSTPTMRRLAASILRVVPDETVSSAAAIVTIFVLALLLERVAEIRGGDTWRNLVAQLDTIKVVEYDRGETRVQQTSELREDPEALLVKLGVPPPPRLHAIGPIPSGPTGPAV